jgi:MaoC like domain
MVGKVFPGEEFVDLTLALSRRIAQTTTVAALVIKESVNQGVDNMGYAAPSQPRPSGRGNESHYPSARPEFGALAWHKVLPIWPTLKEAARLTSSQASDRTGARNMHSTTGRLTVKAPTSDLAVGMEIPVFQRATGLHNWNRYAAVNSEFVNIHMDDEAGRAAGYPTAFGMGNLQWSYLHSLLRTWIGDNGRIVRIGCQFRSANTKGQVVTAHGKVTAIHEEGGETLVDLDVWTENDAGQTMAPGTATVALAKA